MALEVLVLAGVVLVVVVALPDPGTVGVLALAGRASSSASRQTASVRAQPNRSAG